MKLPTPVYEYLPSIYIIVGVLLAANFDNALGKTAATILVFTGVIVFNMRLNLPKTEWRDVPVVLEE